MLYQQVFLTFFKKQALTYNFTYHTSPKRRFIAEVKGAEVNTSTWQVTHLQVKLSNTASEELGFKKRFRSSTVCMPVSLVTAIGDVITVGTDLPELSQNPEITECPE